MLTPLNNGLWPRFFKESGATFTTDQVVKVIDIRSISPDNGEMEFVGDFELANHSVARVQAKYSRTCDAVSEATFCILTAAA